MDCYLTTWKSNHESFQAVAVLVLLYNCTIWILTKHLEKKFDGNYTKMLKDEQDILGNSGEAGTNSLLLL